MMVESEYGNAFKEVYDILQNTDNTLLKEIPTNFIDFIKDNMNTEYKTNIDKNVDLDKQSLLKETESILSLIFRNYWATDEEKKEFKISDEQEYLQMEIEKQQKCKDINEIFKERQTNIYDDNDENLEHKDNLAVVKKEIFIIRILNKILGIFRR